MMTIYCSFSARHGACEAWITKLFSAGAGGSVYIEIIWPMGLCNETVRTGKFAPVETVRADGSAPMETKDL